MSRLVPWGLGSTSPCTMALLLPYVLPPPGFTMRSTSLSCHLRPSLILLLGSFAGTVGGGLVVPHSHLGMLILLPSVPPFFILGPTFNPFKERSTDECYVFMNSIVWNLSPPPSLGTLQYSGDGRDLSCRGSDFQKAQPLLPRSVPLWVSICPCTWHHCSN